MNVEEQQTRYLFFINSSILYTPFGNNLVPWLSLSSIYLVPQFDIFGTLKISKMRLLNTETIQLEDFRDEYAVPYAILSHTWEVEEVTSRDLSEPKAKEMAGYAKITRCCDQARSDGFKYV